MEREDHFGRIVLDCGDREVYSLDLYETRAAYARGFTCRGYYLPPARYKVRWWLPVPMRVELSIDNDVFDAIYEMFGGGTFGGEGGSWERDARYSDDFVLGGTWRDGSPAAFRAEISAPLRLPDRTVWTGRLDSSLDSTEVQVTQQFDFILEQYGSIEPVVYLLVILYFTVFYDRDGPRQADECYRQALRLCGDPGNIKSLGPNSAVTGATFHRGSGCQIECFERWQPSAHEGLEPPSEDSP